MSDEHLAQAKRLLLMGRRIELQNSKELREVSHERETQSIQRALREAASTASEVIKDYYSLRLEGPWTMSITDRAQRELVRMVVESQTVGSIHFRYFRPDGRKQKELIVEQFHLDVLPKGQLGWRDESNEVDSSEGVAVRALARLLHSGERAEIEAQR